MLQTKLQNKKTFTAGLNYGSFFKKLNDLKVINIVIFLYQKGPFLQICSIRVIHRHKGVLISCVLNVPPFNFNQILNFSMVSKNFASKI